MNEHHSSQLTDHRLLKVPYNRGLTQARHDTWQTATSAKRSRRHSILAKPGLAAVWSRQPPPSHGRSTFEVASTTPHLPQNQTKWVRFGRGGERESAADRTAENDKGVLVVSSDRNATTTGVCL